MSFHARSVSLLLFSLVLGCQAPTGAVVDASEVADLGGPLPSALVDHSLFFSDGALLDDPEGPTLSRTLASISSDAHGGRLLAAWFRRFGSTAHSERAGPVQLLDGFQAAHGPDPQAWDLSLLPFKATGVHNRLDLAALRTGGHCGQVRISYASTDPVYQPLHLLFIFEQPLATGDIDGDGKVTCAGTARRWLALSGLSGAAFIDARRLLLQAALAGARFSLAESVEFTVAPWEWRQWYPVADPMGALPFVLDNRPLFQTVDGELLNPPGALRSDFLSWVSANATALDERRLEIPERFRRPSTRVVQGIPRPPLSLEGLDPAVAAAHPTLRQQIELMGCPTCHTTDADFVQTRPDRTVSPFYMKELEARRSNLERFGQGLGQAAPFGPLQLSPVLPK